mgnify:CR=1 FL=1
MQDTDRNYQAFLKELAKMSEFFCDMLSEGRQQLYWERMYTQVTMDEWVYACGQAIDRETFHKVPLPAALLVYVEEYRQEQRDLEFKRERAAAEQRQLAAPAVDLIPRAELVTLIRHLCEDLEMRGPHGRPELPQVHTRIRGYRTPLDADAIEERKAILRAQAKSLEEQHNGTPSDPR